MGDITNRVVAFLMAKCSKVFTAPTTEGKGQSDLQQLLLRVRVIIEEAEGRHITNRMIAYQLNMLRKEMYRGYFTLDTLRIHGQEELKAKGRDDVSNSFILSKFNPAKRLFFSTGNTHMEKDLQQVLDNVNNIMGTMSDFVGIFNNYPPLYRQPYSMHLYIGKCMFGRQMEMDRVIEFLMQIEKPSMKNVGVLPIVGPTNVGKSTLVAHVYNDQRVRNHFSKIVVITGDEINNESPTSMFNNRGVIVYQDNTLRKNDRLLTIIEFSRDVVDQETWNSLYSSACAVLGSGSKIIMTSTSDEIINFGTTQALVLNFLSQEAYWYFFKTITFGSTDSDDHPELETIGMEMARWMNGSFIGANINSDYLSKNLIAKYWQMHLAFFKENIQRNVSLFGKNQCVLMQESNPMSFLIKDKYEFTIYSHYSASLAEDDVPVITMYDVLTGIVKCEGELKVLLWKSHILPFKYYVANCIIEKL
ncbi:unnamed protein product [Urochloa decumbens]|uniref:NB-ARC domain-containing protein n=1 Tax=Urochloa decumbens TaxID=240449 RepID=A0ABC9FP93_9POAL